MQSCSSPPDLEPWQSSAEKHLFASRTSADSAQCLLPKIIHLDFSFHYSPTTTKILRANWCQMSWLYFAPNPHIHPSFAPNFHHRPQTYDWNQKKYIWSTQLQLHVYSVLFRPGKKSLICLDLYFSSILMVGKVNYLTRHVSRSFCRMQMVSSLSTILKDKNAVFSHHQPSDRSKENI